jgi:hypothetical protein
VITVRPEDLTPDVPVIERTAGPTAGASATTTGSDDGAAEVTGIIGGVDERAGTLTINRLQGADVETIRVDGETRITTADGRPIALADLRPSDRIVARGTLEGEVLTADEITASQALPAPGG